MSSMRSASSITHVEPTPMSNSPPRLPCGPTGPSIARSSAPAADLGGLRLEGDAANEKGNGELMLLAQGFEGLMNLFTNSRVGSRINVRGIRAFARPLFQQG